jgi:hypothetical protein
MGRRAFNAFSASRGWRSSLSRRREQVLSPRAAGKTWSARPGKRKQHVPSGDQDVSKVGRKIFLSLSLEFWMRIPDQTEGAPPEIPETPANPLAVPGLNGQITALRESYPELSRAAIARILRVPVRSIED